MLHNIVNDAEKIDYPLKIDSLLRHVFFNINRKFFHEERKSRGEIHKCKVANREKYNSVICLTHHTNSMILKKNVVCVVYVASEVMQRLEENVTF